MPGRLQPAPVHRPQKPFVIALLFAFFLWPSLQPVSVYARPVDQPADPSPCSPAWIAQISADSVGAKPAMMVMEPMVDPGPGLDIAGPNLDSVLDQGPPTDESDDQEERPHGIDLNTHPNDIAFLQHRQQSLRAVGIVEAWGVTFGTPDVTIAVIAPGVELDHEDLERKIWFNPNEIPNNGIDDDGNGYVDDLSGWDFAEQDADPSPESDPSIVARYPDTGTAMAGVAAAETNNRVGIAGVAWNAKVMPLKTHNMARFQGENVLAGRIDYVTEAICYAANAGAEVILLGGISVHQPDKALKDMSETIEAIEYAWQEKGTVVVAPAGECGTPSWWCPNPDEYGVNPPSFPASLIPDMTLGVSSYDFRQLRQRSSASHGDWVDIAAPGENFDVTWRDDDYLMIGAGYNSPSDFAAAHVAGVAALVKAANPTYTPEMIERKLCEHAVRDPAVDYREVEGRRWPHNPHWGCGRLDAEPVLERMPWQAVISPDVMWMPIDHSTRQRCGIVTSENLNEERLALVTDKDWVRWKALPQRAGEKARLEVCVDVPTLSEEQGGRLQAGSQVTERVEVKVQNPSEPTAEARSISDHLTINLAVAQQLHRAFIPVVFEQR